MIKKKITNILNMIHALFPKNEKIELSRGEEAENLAQQYLEKKQLKHLYSNYRTKLGEIDRIMLENDTLIFVEVRLRQNRQVSALESVDIFKQRKLIKTAKYFLQKHAQFQHHYCRFDVVALDELNLNAIIWVKDAFQLQE